MRLSRRGLFIAGGTGAAGAALAACGTSVDTRDTGHDSELLQAALGAELELSSTAAAAAKTPTESEAERTLIEQIAHSSAARADELQSLAGSGSGGAANAGGDASLAGLVQPSEAALAAYGPAAGQLSTEELRSTAIAYLAQVAAGLAGIRGLLGEDPAPQPFVTGLSAKPYQTTEGLPTTTSTTSTTSTSTTTGSG